MFNDSSPRFEDKFDFPLISAGSVLNLVVMDKTSAVAAIGMAKKLLTGSSSDRKLGSLRLQVGGGVVFSGAVMQGLQHVWCMLG